MKDILYVHIFFIFFEFSFILVIRLHWIAFFLLPDFAVHKEVSPPGVPIADTMQKRISLACFEMQKIIKKKN